MHLLHRHSHPCVNATSGERVTRHEVSCVTQHRADHPFIDGMSSFNGTLVTVREHTVTIGD